MGIFEKGLTRYPQKIKDEAKALWDQGMKASQIARQLGISNDVLVRRWCDEEYRKAHNEKVRRKHIPLDAAEYADRFVKGWATRRLQRQA